jgi:hypothetical protein
MIELRHDRLVFQFNEVHEDAQLTIDFQRTLRIPDDDKEYPLPAGLGEFPLRHVDDFSQRVPNQWVEHGGVMLPMYQSEALWINFSGHYPFAVKVATGKINAVTGKPWTNGLNRGPQDYVAVPKQPWIDGYCVEKGIIRQFVAMPLGSGYSAEEQITGEAEYGGLQIVAYPMKRESYERLVRPAIMQRAMFAPTLAMTGGFGSFDMGLAAGGRMRQEIYRDPHQLEDWDIDHASRCFVHIANSLMWREITGEAPPTTPLSANEYQRAGVPWFDYYDEGAEAVRGSSILDKLKSVAKLGQEKGDVPLPNNASVKVDNVVHLRKGLEKGQVREGRF